MSRRLQLSTHCRVPSASDNNPYQPTTIPCAHRRVHQTHHHTRNGYHGNATDTGLSDETFTDSPSYYEYYLGKDRYGTDRSYSDESGSTRLPSCHYENDDESCRRVPRNAAYASGRRARDKGNATVHKDVRRVYPQQYAGAEAGVYQEIPAQALCESIPAAPKRLPASRLSDRPQSSMSSGVTSAIVDGCGGKCQTFENVCYFILQLAFMMGILIGVSLCIAGLVLRKSAARNLQVLVYIGALLAIVSGLLLGIQWNARLVAKKRKLAVRNAKRAPIPLETLNRNHVQHQQQPLMAVQDGQRVVPQIMRPLPPQPDQQGIPWWRRKDLS